MQKIFFQFTDELTMMRSVESTFHYSSYQILAASSGAEAYKLQRTNGEIQELFMDLGFLHDSSSSLMNISR